VLRDGVATAVRVLGVADYPSLRNAILAYLDGLNSELPRPDAAALAVAGPVTGDFLSLTNHPWSFSIAALTHDLGFRKLDVVNDFVAVALAIPRLGTGDRRQIGDGQVGNGQIGDGTPVAGAPIAAIGPGTGLGVSILVPADGEPNPRWIPLPGEGGHVTLPAVTERENAIIQWLHRSGRAHVSAETLIRGQGLSILHAALSALDGLAAPALEPADVTARALDGTDPVAVEAVGIFCAMLGTIAGNLALTAGARGGVYVAGGVVPRFGKMFDRSEFRARFVAKGRMRPYLEAIPTYLVTDELPAFLGLAALLEQG
jgi:glucokinase